MGFVADYSFARPSPAALRAAGYTGVMRYLSEDTPSTHGKILFLAEYRDLLTAGLQVTANYEWYATRPTEGYQAGVHDAGVAEAQADAIGYPHDQPIYVSVDCGALLAQVWAYFQGWNSVARRPVGVYGGQQLAVGLLGNRLASKLWVANAASWSNFADWPTLRAHLDVRADLVQHLDHPLGFNGQIDHNEVLHADYGVAGSGGFLMALTDVQQQEVHDKVVALEVQVTDLENKITTLFSDDRDLSRTANAFHDINQRVVTLTDKVDALHTAFAGAVPVATLSDVDKADIAVRVVALLHEKTA